MSEREAFERILAALHEVALDQSQWPRANGLIHEMLGTCVSSMMFGGGTAPEEVRVHFAWTFFGGERHPELERLYFDNYYALDERVPRVRTLPDGQLFHNKDLYTEQELKTSEAYHAVRKNARAGNAINVRLDAPEGSRIVWFIHDPVVRNDWSSTQLDTIRRLLPHIRHTVSVQQVLANAAALGVTMGTMLEATGVGVLQLDAHGRIVVANDRARDLLRIGEGLLDRGGFLFASTTHDNDHLQRLLNRALPPFGALGAGGSMLVRRSGGLPPLALHVNPVGSRDADFRMWPVAALVLVVDPSGKVGIDPDVAAASLGLTPMEGRVAVLLAGGMNVREVAAVTRRRESTIRSHVKHIFAKHGLSRQADLVRLVRSLAGSREA
ncbi:MAG: hypothetical protein OXT64_15270 [Gammaproteobacteria bacterium]|nr:hypothetical protein [Gammaproteobacteria bacterium]